MTGPQVMWSEVHGSADRLVVSVAGDVELGCAERLRTVLVEAAQQASSVEVDLSQVTFLDSAGLGVLVSARNAARAKRCSFVITRMSETVRGVLEISALLDVLTRPMIFDSGEQQS